MTATVSSTADPRETQLCSEVHPGRPHESRVFREVQPERGVAGKLVYVSPGCALLSEAVCAAPGSRAQRADSLPDTAAGALQPAVCPSPQLGPFATLNCRPWGRGEGVDGLCPSAGGPRAWSLLTGVPEGFALFPGLLREAPMLHSG